MGPAWAAVIMLLLAVGRLTDHDGGTSALTCFMLAVVLAVAGLSSRPAS
jgi:cell division protein FtsW (lipid II flippase)